MLFFTELLLWGWKRKYGGMQNVHHRILDRLLRFAVNPIFDELIYNRFLPWEAYFSSSKTIMRRATDLVVDVQAPSINLFF